MLKHACAAGLALFSILVSHAQLPVNRSTVYDGSASAQVRHATGIYAPNLSMTVEAWVYREDATRCETIVAQDFRNSFWFGFCNNSLRFYRGGGNFVDADRNVTPHRWTHVAAVYDAGPGEVRFYIDGALVATKARSAGYVEVNAPLYLGANPFVTIGGSYPFRGALDEVRVWSTARTGAEIAGYRFLEVNSGAGLVAAFPTGGDLEIRTGATASLVQGAQKQIFGILPRALIIPRRPVFDPVDGDYIGSEYAGAEQMPVRYYQGTNEVDAPALLNAYVSGDVTYIYVGMFGLQPFGDMGPDNRAALSWSFGTMTFDQPANLDQRITMGYNDVPPAYFVGNGTTFVTNTSPSAPVVKKFCAGDVNPPCLEVRAAVPLPSFGQRGLMLDMFWPGALPALNRRFSSPMDASFGVPSTWAPFRIGQVFGAAETVRINASVEEALTVGGPATPVVGAVMRLVHATSLDEIATATTGADGVARFEATVRTNTPLRVELGAPTYWPRLGVRAVPGTGVAPTTTTGGLAQWAACTGCDYADVVFTTRAIPAQESGFAGITPATGHFKRTILRDSPLLELPPSEITILGTNLHLSTEVYLTTCSQGVFSDLSSTPEAATGCSASSFYRVSVLGVSPDHRALTVRLDSATAPGGNLRILVRDTPDRDGRRQWNFIPASVVFGEPTYPLVHGFAFKNERDGTQWDEFSGVYEWHAFDCITPIGPFPPSSTCIGCRAPNPVYLTWYSTFYTAWVEAMTGSCLGMSATSLMFARGLLDTEAFNGAVHYAAGFPGLGPDGDLPPKPQQHQFEFCNYSHPVNLWAHIHRNQAVQTSSEFLNSILSQMSGTGLSDRYSIAGDPNAALGRLRANLRSYVLCFQNEADVIQSHCVVPFALMDGKGVADDGVTLVDRPNSTVIHVYDSNAPRDTACFFEVDRVANTFKYMFTRRRLPDGTIVPVFFTGKGMYTTPLSIWQQPRSMPGVDLLARGLGLVLFGSADGLYTDADGGRWGWETNGVFRDTYLGGKAIAPPTSTNALANTNRNVMFFPPTNRPPASIRVNPRGPNWRFHASEAGTLAFLEVSGATAGDADAISLHLEDGVMRGFKFAPQRASSSFRPTLGLNLGTNPSVVVSWENVAVQGGKGAEFVARHDKLGAEFRNDTGGASRPSIRVLRSDAEGLKTNLFGPFNVPLGASQLASIVDPTNANALRVELDLDRDGTADAITFVTPGTKETPPAPQLFAALEKGEVVISWLPNAGAWTLESNAKIDDANGWKIENAQPVYQNGQSVVVLPKLAAQLFLRLSAAF